MGRVGSRRANGSHKLGEPQVALLHHSHKLSSQLWATSLRFTRSGTVLLAGFYENISLAPEFGGHSFLLFWANEVTSLRRPFFWQRGHLEAGSDATGRFSSVGRGKRPDGPSTAPSPPVAVPSLPGLSPPISSEQPEQRRKKSSFVQSIATCTIRVLQEKLPEFLRERVLLPQNLIRSCRAGHFCGGSGLQLDLSDSFQLR